MVTNCRGLPAKAGSPSLIGVLRLHAEGMRRALILGMPIRKTVPSTQQLLHSASIARFGENASSKDSAVTR
jgi:hypothetical protein